MDKIKELIRIESDLKDLRDSLPPICKRDVNDALEKIQSAKLKLIEYNAAKDRDGIKNKYSGIDIKKIKTNIEQYRARLCEYIHNADSLRTIEGHIGVNRAQISKYLNGKVKPKVETLVEIAEKIQAYKNES